MNNNKNNTNTTNAINATNTITEIKSAITTAVAALSYYAQDSELAYAELNIKRAFDMLDAIEQQLNE